MAKSKFDPSLLTPIDDKKAAFEAGLKPLDQTPDDAGSYLDNLPKEEGFLSKLPRNIVTGLVHMGRNLHNSPHDIAELADTSVKGIGSLLGFPEQAAKHANLAQYFPSDTQSYADVFGQKGEGTLMDNLIQKGIEHAPEIAGGASLLRGGFRRLKGTHQLDQVADAIRNRGLSHFDLPPEMIEQARNYLPPSHATREAIAASNRGNYPSSFSIQSQVGQHQRNLASSILPNDRLLSPAVGDLKQSMLSHLGNTLRATGMHEEADLLSQGINNYRQYIQVKNAIMPVFKKLGLPATALAAIGFGYKKAKEVLKD